MKELLKQGAAKVLPHDVYCKLRQLYKKVMQPNASGANQPVSYSVQGYWTEHNVTSHKIFKSVEDSLRYFYWRTDQYYNYLNLMPVDGQDGKVVLDFGCGPGHDLVGFGVFSKPEKLYGYDVSSSSLAEAKDRMKLHGIEAQLIQGTPGEPIALPDASVDLVHSSGCLHHVEDLPAVLRELHRVLKPGGKMHIMVYNYHSVFVQLYVPYVLQIVQKMYAGLSLAEAFQRSTDGEHCPISIAYKPEEFVAICCDNGFEGEFAGAGVAMLEAELCAKRFEAITCIDLAREHCQFLLDLTFDEHGMPMYHGHHAGVDACFRFRKKK